MGKGQRIDIYLVEKGYAPSRTKAQELIRSGLVSIKTPQGEAPVKDAAQAYVSGEILIRPSSLERYVSRGGLKLEGALDELRLSLSGLKVLDVGMSTGGFTDCLLQRGASSVVGIEVGHSQLSPRLVSDPRVTCLEGVNARNLQSEQKFLNLVPAEGFDLAVVDVSFISLSHIIPSLVPYAKKVLALVKPQFEVGPENLGKGGIVTNPELFDELELRIRGLATKAGLIPKAYFHSPITGKDGNQEFFIYAER